MTVLAVAVNPVAAAAADGDAHDPGAAATAVVAAAVDGDTLQLADGGVLRLASILVPKGAEPLAEAARAALADAVGRALVLEFGPRRTDRHGRQLAQAWLAAAGGTKGAWLQEMLLTRGLARVASTDDTRALVPELLRIEAQARAAHSACGRSRLSHRTPADAGDALDRFQIVEGRVLAAALVRSGGYLNFGADYKTDFTLSFSREALQRLQESGIVFKSLQGVRLRARGWLRYFNGPLIDITHPEQIEVLE
jgi:endonuclease YncB( thermonuclease family)